MKAASSALIRVPSVYSVKISVMAPEVSPPSFLIISSEILPILAFRNFYIGFYSIQPETVELVYMMLNTTFFMLPIQTVAYVISKGILRGGGDTRFLLLADSSCVWFISLPLGALAAFVWHMSPFWIYILMKIDYIIKTIWCVFRLVHKKWIRMIAQDINKAPVPRACEPAGRVS